MRINKYIASCTNYSRRKADELILGGFVSVNDVVITQLGWEIRKRDKVKVKGKLLTPPKNYEYARFYKPTGYITTKSDEKGRKTIYDIIPKEFSHLKPVGRLDKDSSGLIILTNDGDLINELAHPSIKIPKLYRVTTDGDIKIEHLEAFAKGIKIDGKLAYCDSEILEKTKTLLMTRITKIHREKRGNFFRNNLIKSLISYLFCKYSKCFAISWTRWRNDWFLMFALYELKSSKKT